MNTQPKIYFSTVYFDETVLRSTPINKPEGFIIPRVGEYIVIHIYEIMNVYYKYKVEEIVYEYDYEFNVTQIEIK